MNFSHLGKRSRYSHPTVIRRWDDIVFSAEFSCSYAFLEGNILLVQGIGFPNEETERASIAFGRRIVEDLASPDSKYTMIQDWRKYRNATSRARKLFMDSVVTNDRLDLLVFCNTNFPQSMSIRLGRSLGFLKATVFLASTFHDAVGAIQFYRERGALPPEKSLFFGARVSPIARYTEELLNYLENVDWKTGKLIGSYEVNVQNPLLPVFDTITVIRSGLEQTFQERDRAERGLRDYQKNLESLVRERTFAMEASERRYRLLLALSPAPIAVLTPQLDVDYVNEAFYSVFGYTKESLAERGGFLSALSAGPDAEASLRAFLSGLPFAELDVELQSFSGKNSFVRVSLNSFEDALILSFTDITDRKKSEAVLAELSRTDELTGIQNRRQFDAVLARELQKYARSGSPLSLMILDIDHFKKINDSLGHQAGDAVLRELTARVSAQIREIDFFFRIGGEEFAVLMPDTEESLAAAVAERLRVEVSEREFFLEPTSVRVTISIGVASSSEKISTPDRIFAAADARLYHAKRSGRNRVACQDPLDR